MPPNILDILVLLSHNNALLSIVNLNFGKEDLAQYYKMTNPN